QLHPSLLSIPRLLQLSKLKKVPGAPQSRRYGTVRSKATTTMVRPQRAASASGGETGCTCVLVTRQGHNIPPSRLRNPGPSSIPIDAGKVCCQNDSADSLLSRRSTSSPHRTTDGTSERWHRETGTIHEMTEPSRTSA